MAQQRQLLARIHLDRLKQSKPLGPCFTCNGDRLKKTCPIELAKRGKVAPISMAELIDLDIFAAEDLQGVDEMIQRFGVFLEADDEFLVSKATQVAIVDLAGEESGELVARVMAELNKTVRKLKLKSLIRPSKKAFITAGGELSFPVGEIDVPSWTEARDRQSVFPFSVVRE